MLYVVGTTLVNFNTTELCNMPRLVEVSVELGGTMSNPIPVCLGTLSKLTSVTLQSYGTGGWSGTINAVQWSKLALLQTLVLNGYMLTGPLPILLPTSLQSLTIIGVTGTTTSPLSLSNVLWSYNTALTSLRLYYNVNLAAGPTPGNAIPTGIQTLIIAGTAKPIPNSMSVFPWQLYKSLQILTMNGILQGAIPSSFGNYSQLTALDLSSNSLNGSIDAVNWSSLPVLQSLELSYNQFSSFGNAFASGPASLSYLGLAQSSGSIAGTFSNYLLGSGAFNRL